MCTGLRRLSPLVLRLLLSILPLQGHVHALPALPALTGLPALPALPAPLPALPAPHCVWPAVPAACRLPACLPLLLAGRQAGARQETGRSQAGARQEPGRPAWLPGCLAVCVSVCFSVCLCLFDSLAGSTENFTDQSYASLLYRHQLLPKLHVTLC